MVSSFLCHLPFNAKIEILSPILGEEAKSLPAVFAPGVIRIDKQQGAVVEKTPRYDTMSRECLRHPGIQG